MRGRSIGCGMVLAAASLCALGEVPKIEGIYPAGGQRGTEFEVSVVGKFDPWPVQARCDDERITFSPSEKDKGVYQVRIPPEVDAGPVLVRFFNKDGATAPRQFVVGDCPERAQSGAEAMVIAASDLPLTVNGKLESNGAVDRFALELQAGQVLLAEVVSYALDAPLDPLLHLRGPQGEQLAFNHDATRIGLDPRLVFQAPAAGTYELHLSAFAYPPRADIRFTGGEAAIYRLTLGVSLDLPKIELPEPCEGEGEEAHPLSIPSVTSGTIDPAGDIDRYRFAAKKGDVLRFEIAAAAIGSWMDPVLVVRDGTGKELKRQDDIDGNTQHDVAIDWSAPEDGEFTAEVSDLNGVGGPGIAYHLRVAKPEAGIEATVAGGEFALAPGKKLEIVVKVARQYGYQGELEVSVEGLPPGIEAAPAEVSEKGEAKLSLQAAEDAAPANVALTFWASPKGNAERRVACQIELKGATTDAGDLLLNRTGRGWLTVLEAKKNS